MIVRVEIGTGVQTVIEPINTADCEGLKEVMKRLYRNHVHKNQEGEGEGVH